MPAAQPPCNAEERAAAAAEAATRAAAAEILERQRRIPVREDYFLPEDATAAGDAAEAASEGVLTSLNLHADLSTLEDSHIRCNACGSLLHCYILQRWRYCEPVRSK